MNTLPAGCAKMESKIIDSTTKRKNRIAATRLHLRKGVPVFSIIEISVVAACNRRCPFCPVSSGNYYKNLGLSGVMKEGLYQKLLKDLADIDYSGMILFSGESEPLLHKKLNHLIRETKKALPRCRIEVNTNGDLLAPNKLQKLFESGLDTLSISLYDGPEQIEKFDEMRDSVGVSPKKILLRRRYFAEGNFGINMTNRGGLVDSNSFRDAADSSPSSAVDFPRRQVCFYPFYMLTVDVGGNVTICSHDWAKNYIVGNFATDHIFNIWTGTRFEIARKKLAAADRSLPSCQNCDALGDLIGRESFDEWTSLYGSVVNLD